MEGVQNLNVSQNASAAVAHTSAGISCQNLHLNASKLERTPGTDTVSFSGNGKQNMSIQKPEVSTGKKWALGLSSFFIPGLGQGINGQWGKGAGFFLGYSASLVTATAVCVAHALANASLGMTPLLFLAPLSVRIWSIVDAVKNAKPDCEE